MRKLFGICITMLLLVVASFTVQAGYDVPTLVDNDVGFELILSYEQNENMETTDCYMSVEPVSIPLKFPMTGQSSGYTINRICPVRHPLLDACANTLKLSNLTNIYANNCYDTNMSADMTYIPIIALPSGGMGIGELFCLWQFQIQ